VRTQHVGAWLNVVIQKQQDVAGRMGGAPVARRCWPGCRLLEHYAGKPGIPCAKPLRGSIRASVGDDDGLETAGHRILLSKGNEETRYGIAAVVCGNDDRESRLAHWVQRRARRRRDANHAAGPCAQP